MNDDGIADNWGSLRVRIDGPLLAVDGAPLISHFTETVAERKVGPADGWVSSGLSLRRGDRVLISAEGTWIGGPRGEPIDANGYRRTRRRQRAGALIGRIGQHGAPFTAGKLHLLEAAESGKLYLAINEVGPRKPRGVLENLLGVPPAQVLLPQEGADPVPRARGSVTVTIRAPDGFGERPEDPDGPLDLHCRLLATLRGHRSEVTCVDFSPDGAQIASGSRDTTLLLWDAKTGKRLKTMQGHRGAVEAVAFSPDGRQLVSASQDRTVRLWDAAAGQPLRVLAGHTDAVWSVAFSPDGTRVASTGKDRSVRVWDVARGEGLVTLGVDSPSWCVAVPPGGKDVAAISEKGWIRAWDAGTGHPKRVIFARAGRCRCLAYSSDGKRLASAGDRPYLHVWEAATGKCLGSVDLEGGIRSLVFSPDGKHLATASGRGIVRLWDPATLEQLRSLQAHDAEVRGIAFSPDSRRLATASFDGTVRLWALEFSAPPDPKPGAAKAGAAPRLARPAGHAPGPEPAEPGPADDPED
jgi:WD40 repeat protein